MNVEVSHTRNFKYYFSWSMFFHIALALLFALVGKLFHDQLTQKKDFNMRLVESSVRVDLVAMPKFTLKELKALPPVSKGDTVALPKEDKSPDQINPDDTVFKKAVKKVNFLDMMKNLSNKRVKKSKKTKKTRKKKGQKNGLNIDANTITKLIAEGNKISQGAALSGTGSSSGDMSEFTMYMGSLPVHVRVHWKLPGYLMNKDLKCRIRIYLKSNGSLIKAEVFESSGEKEFDDRAMKAVKAASPFPTVPKQNISNAVNGEIVLGFPL